MILQFSFIYTWFPLECHKWAAVPMSGYLRCELHCYFHSECCIGGKSMAAPHVNCSFVPTHQRWAQGWTGHKYSTVFQVWYEPAGNGTQPTSFGSVFSTNCPI